MVDSNNDRNKRIQENFEKILPQLWDIARSNEDKLKLDYLAIMHKKLIEEIKMQISAPSFDTWFSDLTIEDLKDDNRIIFGTNTTLVKEWLEQRYMSLIEKSLRTVTNSNFKVSFVLRKNENSDCKNEKPYTIEQCIVCNCIDFQSKNIELPIGIKGIVSMTVKGLICTNCGEEYYSETIKKVVRLFKQREAELESNPLHFGAVKEPNPFDLQNEEYKRLSMESMREDD